MSNKKHIDRVFQEKLKDFEVSPSPKVWKNIKGELEQSNQNKKVIPIWLRIGGIAALLLLLLTVGNLIVSNTGNTNKVVDTENNVSPSDNEVNGINNNKPVEGLQNTTNDEVLSDVNSPDLNSETTNEVIDNTEVANTNSSGSDANLLNNTSVSETKSEAINNSSVVTSRPSESKTNLLNNNSSSELNALNKTASPEDINNYASAANKNPKDYKTNTNAVTQRSNEVVTNQSSNVLAQNENPLNKDSEKANTSKTSSDVNSNDVYSTQTRTDGIAQNESPSDISSEKANESNNGDDSSTPTNNEGVAQNNLEKQNNSSNERPEFDKDKADAVMKNNTNDAVVENQSNQEEQEEQEEQENLENITTDEETDEDSPSIEEEIANAEDIIEKEEEKVNRWQVYANIAPVYYNTLGKGSHIDDQFVQNPKSGETNTSYGVNVSYVLNDKLKLRSGFNSLDLSYDTDNVILYENVGNNASSSPRNLDLTTTGQSFSAISASNLGAQQLSNVIGDNANAAISQRIAYYEVPLELEYNLVDNKFGLNVIGGFSTFILNDNKVYSEFEGFKTEVGKANNINNVSFSGNLGLGLDYKFSKKIKLNIQPTFKYQLNAYKNTSGNFRPYIVGIYTGLSYKF